MLLRVYTLMLANEGGAWEVFTTDNPQQALTLIDQSAFDVVVSDMRMPGMSGAELMARVRDHHPRISRVILSALQDQEEVAQSLGATHQFVPKPFEVRELKETLRHLGGLDAFLRNERLQALVARLSVLPSFPSAYLEIMAELATDEPSLETIARIIARDPGLTAKILQVANSAVVGLAHEVSNPYDAVQFLGFSTVRSLALGAHVFSQSARTRLRGFCVERLWNHATRTAWLARNISQWEGADSSAAEDACTAGMLHDIGKLMLADNLPGDFARALERADREAISLHAAELEVFGATHAAVGAYLLGLWGLPARIVEAVAFHHRPCEAGLNQFNLVVAVHAANLLEQELSGDHREHRPPLAANASLSAPGLDRRFEIWRARAADLFAHTEPSAA